MPDEPLRFETAEGIAGRTGTGVTCAACQAPITTYYYEAAGKTFCGDCKRKIESTVAASQFEKSSFVRAAVFGFGGALAGALLYFAVVALTGYEIGLIAILVGYMVGWTVHRGSRGRAGRSYQVLAFSLTYLAIGMTYSSLMFKELVSKDSTSGAKADSSKSTAVAPAPSDTFAVSDNATPKDGTSPSFLTGLGMLALLVLAMPVVASFGNLPGSLISLLIMAFALRQAWHMNRAPAVTFTGPYHVGAVPAPEAAG